MKLRGRCALPGAGEGRFGRRRWFGFAPGALGASAAVNSVMVVDICLFPTRTVLLYGLLPMPAALLGALWLMRDVTGTMEGGGGGGGGQRIAHAGHLGGAATGLAFFLLFKCVRRCVRAGAGAGAGRSGSGGGGRLSVAHCEGNLSERPCMLS